MPSKGSLEPPDQGESIGTTVDDLRAYRNKRLQLLPARDRPCTIMPAPLKKGLLIFPAVIGQQIDLSIKSGMVCPPDAMGAAKNDLLTPLTTT